MDALCMFMCESAWNIMGQFTCSCQGSMWILTVDISLSTLFDEAGSLNRTQSWQIWASPARQSGIPGFLLWCAVITDGPPCSPGLATIWVLYVWTLVLRFELPMPFQLCHLPSMDRLMKRESENRVRDAAIGMSWECREEGKGCCYIDVPGLSWGACAVSTQSESGRDSCALLLVL